MTKSMVSRRLARLEADLGMPLVARSTRGMSLTEAGADFLPYAQRMIADLQSARDALSQTGEATGRLRLAAPLSFGTVLLAPVLAELALQHPRLEISTSYSDRRVDLVGEGFDAAVRLGTLADSTLIARRIAPMRAVAVASPAYVARRGAPRTPEALADHDTIPHGETPWLFTRNGRTVTVRPRGRFKADAGEAELAAVVAGLGVSVMPMFLARGPIARNEIVTVLDDWEVPPAGLYIVRPPPADPLPNKIRALTRIVIERFGHEGWDAPGE